MQLIKRLGMKIKTDSNRSKPRNFEDLLLEFQRDNLKDTAL